jgi:hypothetical protein
MSQQYVSKLDAFDSFVSHAKLAPLVLQPVSGPAWPPVAAGETTRKVILVDDLPQVNSSDQRRRLAASLGTLFAHLSYSPKCLGKIVKFIHRVCITFTKILILTRYPKFLIINDVSTSTICCLS